MLIRPETPGDAAAVRDVHERAFEQAAEADLVDTLRRDAHPAISLVAEVDGQVIGHIFFSPVEIEHVDATPDDRILAVMGLAPMAVRPAFQQRGVGTALVRQGLRSCREAGVHAVVVLGHPSYYPRFGFTPAAQYGLWSEYDVPSEAFMALELVPGALDGARGIVTYHAAFGDVA